MERAPSPAALGMNQERPADDFIPRMFCSDSDGPTNFDADSRLFPYGEEGVLAFVPLVKRHGAGVNIGEDDSHIFFRP